MLAVNRLTAEAAQHISRLYLLLNHCSRYGQIIVLLAQYDALVSDFVYILVLKQDGLRSPRFPAPGSQFFIYVSAQSPILSSKRPSKCVKFLL